MDERVARGGTRRTAHGADERGRGSGRGERTRMIAVFSDASASNKSAAAGAVAAGSGTGAGAGAGCSGAPPLPCGRGALSRFAGTVASKPGGSTPRDSLPTISDFESVIARSRSGSSSSPSRPMLPLVRPVHPRVCAERQTWRTSGTRGAEGGREGLALRQRANNSNVVERMACRVSVCGEFEMKAYADAGTAPAYARGDEWLAA